ncbi:MAG: cryptochrome/photolyase family protein [Deltaproteobacteria bacterium]
MNIFWFRRDLRLQDNHALLRSLENGPTLPVFIFDTKILNELEKNDARVTFIYNSLKDIDQQLRKYGSGLSVFIGDPISVFTLIFNENKPEAVYANEDYEPYAIIRDREVEKLAEKSGVKFLKWKDQVIFEKSEIMKSDGRPFQVFTPYKNKWLQRFMPSEFYKSEDKLENIVRNNKPLPTIGELGFIESDIRVKPHCFTGLEKYQDVRDFPALESTSNASVHLRFGTLSVREAVMSAMNINPVLLSELIWREFFMQILYHFPYVENESFNPAFRNMAWLNDQEDFEKWKSGKTGFPMVDAGMRELNQTGYMHNRVRMVAAGFLCKHLLIDWKWGERYFAAKLLDYDQAANNGNWQWAAGTGCDAAPYFRIFNPVTQQEKFDKNFEYVKRWVPEYGTSDYPDPIIDHKLARERALSVFSKSLNK